MVFPRYPTKKAGKVKLKEQKDAWMEKAGTRG